MLVTRPWEPYNKDESTDEGEDRKHDECTTVSPPPKVMCASFDINSHSVWNEVAEKLFVSFSVFLSFCLLGLYNYTLHDLSYYSDSMQ